MAESSEASEGPLATLSVQLEAELRMGTITAYTSGLKQALRVEFEGLKGQIDTSLEALEGRLSAFENQTNTQLKALEAKLTLLSPQEPPGEQLKLLKHLQDLQGPLQAPDAPRAKTTHEPLSRATSARPGRAAASELTPIPRTSQPRPGTPSAAVKASEDAQSSTVRSEELKPAKGEHKEDQRLIFRHSDLKISPKAPRENVILTLNHFLTQSGFPSFMRIVDVNYTETDTLSALLNRDALAEKLVSTHRDSLLTACHQTDSTVIAVELNEQ
ncbi:hypothetical protein AJ79_10331 [Helicocarpus griseus UAMH5409]|uniref:Uncharacterized protein n=1 Tax=Helicocarpus griseus UAMH5409 TaxID=1447875 RepID=A0A2B7WEF3_9EURO|nr:hypothetical protein AJ79_10331 [Helicocarpus griseus UAMH5409]